MMLALIFMPAELVTLVARHRFPWCDHAEPVTPLQVATPSHNTARIYEITWHISTLSLHYQLEAKDHGVTEHQAVTEIKVTPTQPHTLFT